MKDKHFLFFLACLAIALIVFCIGTNFKEIRLLDGDSVTHYRIAHYAYQYPHLLLDVWGKPFFTLVSSPFAHLGFYGIQVFNILCACISAYLVYKCSDLLGIRNAFLAPLILFFVPVYIMVMPTGLTEPFFSLVLIAGIYFSIRQKYILAACIISFLPYCRSEGFFLVPVFGLLFVMLRNYKALPWLLLGTVTYGIVCHFAVNDFLWMFHKNPYKYEHTIYGHGGLFDFVLRTKESYGYPAAMLFLIGLGCTGYKYISSAGGRMDRLVKTELLLVYGCVILNLVMHSLFWWQGIFGSFGLLRVLAGTAPALVIGSLRGLDRIAAFFKGRKLISMTVYTVLVVFMVWYPFRVLRLPMRLDENGKTVETACDWIKANHYDIYRLYCSDVLSPVFLDKDPYDPNQCGWLMEVNHEQQGKDLMSNSIILWESSLGPRECRWPLSWLKDNKDYFQQLKEFVAKGENINDSTTYKVYVFKKIK